MTIKHFTLSFILLFNSFFAFSQDDCGMVLGLPDTLWQCQTTEPLELSVPFTASDTLNIQWNTGQDSSSIILAGAGLYIVTITTPSCTVTDSTLLILQLQDSLNLPDTLWQCQAMEPLTLSVPFSTDSIFNIQWSTNEQDSLITVVNAGVYTVTVSTDHCSLSDSSLLIIDPLPSTLGFLDTIRQCQGMEPIELSVPFSPSDTLDIQWSTNEQDSLIIIDNAGLYIVTVATSRCSVADSTQFIIDPLPSLGLNNLNTNYCQNEISDTIVVQPMGASLTGAAITMLGNDTFLFNPSLPDTGITFVTLVSTNEFGCTNMYMDSSAIFLAPSINLSLDNVCFGDTSRILINTENTLEAALTIAYGNGATTSSDFLIEQKNYLYPNPGFFNIAIEVHNNNGCFDVDTVAHTVHELPQPVITGLNNNYCSDSASDTLSFTPIGGSLEGIALMILNDSQAVFNPNGLMVDDNLEIAYTVVNDSGCSNSSSVFTDILLTPNGQFFIDDVCLKDSATIILNIHSLSINAGITMDYGNGQMDVFTPNNIPEQIKIFYSQAGSFTSMLLIDNENGCTSQWAEDIEIFPLPNPTFTPLLSTYCQSDPIITLSAASGGGVFSGPGVSMINESQAVFDLSVGGSQLNISYFITSSDGCENEQERIIDTIYAVPILELYGLDFQYCEGTVMDTIASNINGGYFIGNSTILNDFNTNDTLAIINPAIFGVFTLGFRYETDAGCRDTVFQTTEIFELPIADIGPDTFLISGVPLVISNLIDNTNYVYEWSNGATTNSIEILNPGFYILQITNANSNCTASDTLLVDFESAIIEQYSIDDNWHIYPNPSFGKINITGQLRNKNTYVQIFDLYGKLQQQKPVITDAEGLFFIEDWPINQLKPGVYYCRLWPSNKTIKFIKI